MNWRPLDTYSHLGLICILPRLLNCLVPIEVRGNKWPFEPILSCVPIFIWERGTVYLRCPCIP